MDVAITVLGGFAVVVGPTPVPGTEWRRRSASDLVKLLALQPRCRLHREQVMDHLWPETSPDEAAPRLHKAAHYARRALGDPGALVLAGELVTLFPERDVRVDAEDFEQAARLALERADPDAAGRAADRYGGPLLPDDPYAGWVLEPRERLQQLYLDVLRLARRWDQLLALSPADEPAHLALMTAATERGDRAAALHQFERLELALRHELGVRPGRAATALRTRLLDADPEPGAGDGRPGPLLVGGADGRRQLDGLLDEVADGRGRTLFLGGPAGVGKTATLAWLEARAADRGMRVGHGVAAQVEGAWPYAPVVEALADLSRRHPALLDGLDDRLRRELENGLTGGGTEWTTRSSQQRLFVAAAELVRLAAGGAGAVLVVDDADQVDDASLRLLHYLARSTESERVLVALASRAASPGLDRLRQSLAARAAATALDLEPLPYPDVRDLVRHLEPTADEAMVRRVHAASGGLPLFVTELVRSPDAGPDLVARSLLPPRLDAETSPLSAAAVLGSAFDTDEFLAVTGLPGPEGYAALGQAARDGLAVRTESGWAFRHGLVRDALLARLSPARLRDLHGRAARALERLGRPAARVGHHLLQAGDRAAAVPWMLRAARASATLGAYREALDGLAAVRPAASGPDLVALLSLRGELLSAEADPGAVDAFREALDFVDDPADRSRLRARLARAATAEGDLETATLALEGLALDGSADDADLLLARGHLAFYSGDLDAAAEAAAEARRRVALGAQEWQLFDLVTLQGLVAHTRGQWFERLELEMWRGVKRPEMAARIFDSHLCVAEYLLYGPTPYPEVRALAGELQDTAERAGVLRAVAFARALLGGAAFLMGDLDRAGAELREAVELHRDLGSVAGEAYSLQRLAEVHLARGSRAEANRLLRRALPLARFSSIPLHVLARVYGTLVTAAPDPAAAREVVERAEAALGAGDHCEFCSVTFVVPAARACADAGDLPSAERYLEIAERSVSRWEGTAWRGALDEARAHLAAARGEGDAAEHYWARAAELFAAAGQPRDARRCLEHDPVEAARG